jgi:glycosyltransferase involved in cell wall biosynthesis
MAKASMNCADAFSIVRAPRAGVTKSLTPERFDLKMSAEVSVVIPTYNRAHLVFAAINSVIAQRAANFELIVVDDGSTDDTWRELDRTATAVQAEHANRLSMQIVRTENRGVAAARNTGVAIAAAPLVAFLDSDDLWGPDKLARQIEYMRANPQCMISQTDEYWLSNGGRVNPGLRHRKAAGDIFIDSLRTCLVTPSTVIMQTRMFREIGGFDEDFLAAEDYDLWLRILARHEIGFLAEYHATRRSGHRGQLSMLPAIDRFRILALLKLLATDDLNSVQRRAVCEALAEKCDIYAQGLVRRGHGDFAAFILEFAERARNAWREGGIEARAACASGAATMRNHIKCHVSI